MTRRYHVSELPSDGGLVSLSPEEAGHASRVMRVQVGDAVTLFDGKGNEADAIVCSIAKRECVCKTSPPKFVDRESKRALHLGIALPKADRAKELIERLTELGVDRVTPLHCERSQRPPSPGLLGKLTRVVIEACKQSGRNRAMSIAEALSADEFFRAEEGPRRWIAHPQGEPLNEALVGTSGDRIVVAIGPEGGWTDREVTAATIAGFRAIGLGPRIYRIETAAVCIAARLAE